MLHDGMWLGRVRCALALSWLASCSFPNYDLYNPPAGSSGSGGGGGASGSAGSAGMPAAACDDEEHNGAESDVDCGGNCKGCDPDQRCHQAADCASLVCLTVCQPSDCKDEVRNGLETGRDCGGGCQGCDNGIACKQNSDCLSRHCEGEVCVSAGCTDAIVNGHETDLDCGGPECAPCAVDQTCEESRDCTSRRCQSNDTCAAATCSDSTQNQGESDLDCGGLACSPCQLGERCEQPRDCESMICQSGICVPLDPADQPLSKAAWTISTSESATETDPELAIDGDLDSCWTSGKAQYAGMYVELDLGKPRYFFRALVRLTSGPNASGFPASANVYVSSDGTFGDPVKSSIGGNQYTWFNFTTAQVGRYVRFELAQSKALDWSIGDIALYN
jgi:hypothetical protein